MNLGLNHLVVYQVINCSFKLCIQQLARGAAGLPCFGPAFLSEASFVLQRWGKGAKERTVLVVTMTKQQECPLHVPHWAFSQCWHGRSFFFRSNELLKLQDCSLAPKRLLNEIEFSMFASYVIYIYVCVCIHISGYKCSTNHQATVVLLHSNLHKFQMQVRRSMMNTSTA